MKWLDIGFIYNIYSEAELINQNLSDNLELRVLETGWRDGGGIHYAKLGDIDFFVTPRVAKKLHDLM